MEVNSENGFVKYSRLVEENAQDFETSSISQEVVDNQRVEILASANIEKRNLLNAKPERQKICLKPLVGLSLAFMVIVSGLVAGLIVISMRNQKLELKNQNLVQYLEFKEKIGKDLKAQNENIFWDLENVTNALKASDVLIKSLKQDIQNIISHNQKMVKDLENKHLNCSNDDELEETLAEDLNAQTKNLTKDLEKIESVTESLKHIVPVEDVQKLLFIASEMGNVDKVRLSLELGANLSLRDDDQKTPLIHAVKKGHFEVVKLLIENEADVNAKDLHWSCLDYAAVYGFAKIAELLIQNGANANATNEHNSTALHLVASLDLHRSPEEIIELLLKYGADIDALDDQKKTPLHIALSWVNLRAVDMLLKHGARTDLKDENGMTALEEAKKKKFPSDWLARMKNN